MGVFSVKQPYRAKLLTVADTVLTQLRKENLIMKRKQSLLPLRYGRGTQKVTLYAPTTALPYYRLGLYRMGGKRLQRTFKSLEKAKEEAANHRRQTRLRRSYGG